MARIFPSHGGLLEARREGQVVFVHGSGSTNVEATQAFFQALMPLVAELEGSRWGVLGSTEGEAVLTPDAEAQMTAAAPILSAKGRVAVAIVVPQTPLGSIMQSQWTRVYRDAGCALSFFPDQMQALVWLQSVIADD